MIFLRKQRSCMGIALLLLFGLTSCGGIPRIIILHDPLSAQEHLQLGIIYESQGDQDLAISEYRRALKKGGGLPEAQFRLGNIYYQQKNYAAAETAYSMALRGDDGNAPLLNNLANLYLRRAKKLREAEALVQKAIEMDPPRRAVYLDTLGAIYLARGDYLAALDSYKTAERIVLEGSPLQSQLRAHRKQVEDQLKKQAEDFDSEERADVLR